MSKLANQWIDIFRAGDFGDKGSFSERDVQRIVDNYDPAKDEAPVTVGHPTKTNAPAFAWVKYLRRVGNTLQAQLGQVVPEFEELVDKGIYKKRSAGLRPDTGNGHSLHHVAFLGGKPPEVKGLAEITLSQEDKTVEIEFSEENGMAMTDTEQKTFNERMKVFFAGLFGGEPSTKTFSEAEVQDISTRAAAAAVSAAIAPFEVRLKAQETQFSERENTLVTGESSARAVASMNHLKAKGAWVPAFDAMGLPIIFEELAQQTATIEFGESKAKKTKLEIFTEFMDGLGKIVPSEPIYVGQQAKKSPNGTVQFNETDRVKADGNSVLFAEAVQQRMADKGVEFMVAWQQVTKERPDLRLPGGASAGQV